jgi:hypothetical protein
MRGTSRRSTAWTRVAAALLLVVAGVVATPALAGAHGSDHGGHDGAHGEQQHDDTHIEQHGNTELAVHDCSGRDAPTDEDEANAEELIDTVTAALEKYQDIAVAEEDGYRITDEAAQSASPIDHYMRSGGEGQGDPDRLHPKHPDGLVYFAEDDGSQILLGAVWRSRAECPPQPAGPLTVWHDHSPNGCPSAHPDCPLATGEPVDEAHVPKMFHVWIFEGVEDPFAHDLPGALGGHGDGHERGPAERPRLPFETETV